MMKHDNQQPITGLNRMQSYVQRPVTYSRARGVSQSEATRPASPVQNNPAATRARKATGPLYEPLLVVQKHMLQLSKKLQESWYQRDWKVLGTVAITIFVLMTSMLVPVFTAWQNEANYDLSAAKGLLETTPDYLQKKLTYDASKNSWMFNQAVTQQLPTDPNESASVGAVKYSAQLPSDLVRAGLTLTDTTSKLDIVLKPQFGLENGQEQQGHVVYPITGSTSQLVYSFKHNGVKEDILLYQSQGDSAEFSYALQLPAGMEARVQNDGSVGIFGGDPTLFGNISYGSDKDKTLIEKARQNSAKTHLYYEIPAPVITGKGTENVRANFAIDGNALTVRVSGLANAHYPLSIDPSMVMDTTGCAWQASGNNEDNVNFSGCQVSRSGLSGGTVGSWTSSSPTGYPASPPSWNRLAVLNGYMYFLFQSSIYYASVDASTGVVGALSAASASPLNRGEPGFATANGYLYILGGNNAGAVSNTVQMNKPDSNGNITSAWQTLTGSPLNTARSDTAATAYNGYVYVAGGCSAILAGICTTTTSAVEYAHLRGDGTLTGWTSMSGTSLLPSAQTVQLTRYNGFLYAIASNASGNATNQTWYARINVDGSVGAWNTGTALPVSLGGPQVQTYNGYLYVMGGATNDTTYTSTVYVAKIYANGSIGQYNTSTSLGVNRYKGGSVAYNGRIYYVGGCSAGSSNCTVGSTITSTVLYTTISTTLGNTSGYSGTSTYNSAGVMSYATVVSSGYVYLIGGTTITSGGDSGQINTARYAPINTDGSLGTWSTTSSNFTNQTTSGVGCNLTECKGRLNPAAGTYNGYIYLAGGLSNGTGVYWADIQSAVQCTGVNTPVTGCAGAGDLRGTSGAATWTTQLKDFVTNSTTTYNNSDGRGQLAMQIYNGYMYLVGGRLSTADTASIYYAPLAGSGGVGTFTTTTSLPSARSGSKTFVSGGRFYVVGGGAGSGWAFTTSDADDVIFTTINSSTGALSSTCPSGYTCLSGTSWVDANASANGGSGSSFVAGGTGLSDYGVSVSNGYLYITGGQNGSGTSTTYSAVYKAIINNNGSIGSWSTIASMGNNRYGHGNFALNGFMYTIGGCVARNGLGGINCNSTGQMLNDYQSAVIYNGGGGMAGAALGPGTLVAAVTGNMGVAANGYIYSIGGATSLSTPTATATVYYARTNSDGTLAAWATTSSLNTARYDGAVTVYGGYVYVLGGRSSSSILSTGEYAKINGDGTLSNWTQFTMSDARQTAAAFAYNGYLYIAGGTSDGTTGLSSVKYAAIGSDGAPGSWSTTTAGFTTARYGLQGFSSSNGSVYVMGGYDGTNYLSDVQYATPAGSGDITSWSYGPSFPFARSLFSSVVSNGYVYIYSGKDSSGARSDIYYAPIMANGTLGRWDYAGSISGTAEYRAGAATIGGYLYIFGGCSLSCTSDLTQTSDVYRVPLYGMASVAHYSLFLNTDMRTMPASYFTNVSTQSGNSSINTSLSLATATTGFAYAAGNTGLINNNKYPIAITNSDGGTAYMLFIALDDTASVTFGESSTAGSSFSYLCMNYHANPAMRLRGGKTFNSNVLQSLDAQ